jgi:hypothetical protein
LMVVTRVNSVIYCIRNTPDCSCCAAQPSFWEWLVGATFSFTIAWWRGDEANRRKRERPRRAGRDR